MFDFEVAEHGEKTLIIFSGQLEGGDGFYGNEIDRILKSRNSIYKEIILIFPNYIADDINAIVSKGDRLVSNLRRAKCCSKINLVSFDDHARLKIFKNVDGVGSSLINKEGDPGSIIKSGLLALVGSRKDQVILKSPPGTVFKKPSNKIFGEFIKASELAVGYSEVKFVAFCLLCHRPKSIGYVNEIWIDTSGISVYVEALISYLQAFGGRTAIKYYSFQSYGDGQRVGYKVCAPENLDSVWVIISASRSNDMGKDIFNSWKGLNHDQILTLLSYNDTQYDQKALSFTIEENDESPISPGDQIVVNISQYSDCHLRESISGSEIPVKIIGENFTVQIQEPNQVLVRRVHKTPEISTFIEFEREKNSLRLNAISKNKERLVFFDFINFRESDSELNRDYENWLKNIINWHVPASIRTIVYDSDDANSVKLYNDVMNFLPKSAGGDLQVAGVDLKNIDAIDRCSGLIAVSPVITRGHSLVKLNSDLRLLGHDAQRIFITPFATPHSSRDYSLFSSSLVLAPNGMKYSFFNFRKIFIGHDVGKSSWDRELELIDRFPSSFWDSRKSELRARSTGLTNGVGVSSVPSKKLAFNVDFAFWKPGYDVQKVSHPAVYATINSILQGLREKPHTDFDKDSLFRYVYQHSVLDPLNFIRFNDPLLQSCLWRCSHDGELDYRASSDLSTKFADIMRRLAQSYSHENPNAVLDLLVGIAINKIVLAEICCAKLMVDLKGILGNFEGFSDVISSIQGIQSAESSTSATDLPPF